MQNPCQRCGACCAFYKVKIPGSETDDQLGGIVPVEMTVKSGMNGRVMKGTEGFRKRCIALEGNVGVNVTCRIYDQRPSPCREVAAGSDQCQRARARHGLPLLVPLHPAANDDGDDDRNPPCAA